MNHPKPMLAANARDARLRFPLLASAKRDGIRALVSGGVLLSRSGLPIPNSHAQARFGRADLDGLDGELIVGAASGPGVLARTNAVMRAAGEPAVSFHVFDDFSHAGPFAQRLAHSHARIQCIPHCVAVAHLRLTGPSDLQRFHALCLADGYEGSVLRAPGAAYKHGRSTADEGAMLRNKNFTDSEGQVIGCQAARGLPQLGALRVRDLATGVQFNLGSGFTDADRRHLWATRERLPGLLVKYLHQPYGAQRAPRHASFLGFRHALDMTPPRSLTWNFA